MCQRYIAVIAVTNYQYTQMVKVAHEPDVSLCKMLPDSPDIKMNGSNTTWVASLICNLELASNRKYF